jgi:subtilase-type serine protease
MTVMIAGDLAQFRNQGPVMRANFRTIEFLAATTALSTPNAMLSQRVATRRLQCCSFRHFMSQPLKSTGAILLANLPAMLVSLGAVISTTSVAPADTTSNPTMIPLQHVQEQGAITWLGTMAGINDGSPRLYMFDTGSDQFNVQIAPDTTGVKPVPGVGPKLYPYDDGSTANWVRRVQFESLSYYDPADTSAPVVTFGGKYQAGKVLDILFTDHHRKDRRLSDEPVFTDDNGTKFYADLDVRQAIENDQPGEQPPFYGIFGAGDFLNKTSAPSSAIGGRTKSGYIVSANNILATDTSLEVSATPGCAPCLIMDLNSSLRAQFTSFAPWGEKSDEDKKFYRDTFPGSGANASPQFEGAYGLKLAAGDGKTSHSEEDVPVLLDTGTPRGGELEVGDKKYDELKKAGVISTESGREYIKELQISAPDGEPVTLNWVNVTKTGANDNGINFIGGLDFFLNESVMYDLEKQITAYTPYFVTADNFSTDAAAEGELQLNRITTRMGNDGLLGIAGTISGSGDLMLDPKTDVRLTAANTYTGVTTIGRDAHLYLAGPGSIERSAKVVVNGTLDITERGSFNDNWGISKPENYARIRSLGGTGAVNLGDRTLVLTAANDVFAGSINDLDVEKKNMSGKLAVAGGVQTLSGKNDYSGMTTVGSGAGLLLTDSGSITHDVTTSGLLGNDGQIGGLAQANDGGVVGGTGSFGGVDIADGGTVAPGSVADPGMSVAALTVNGDFTQQAGSTYQAGLANSSDLIDIAGSAAIDSGAQVELVRQGAASVDTRYTLLTAAGGLNGTYGGLTGILANDSPFVDFKLTYDPKNVFLHVDRSSAAFADTASTLNQRSAAAAAEALGDGNLIHDSILFLTTEESRNAFDQLSGEIHASTHSALIEDSHFVRDAASDRIRAAFEAVAASPVPVMSYGPGGPEPAAADGDGLVVWGRGFGAWGHLDGNGNAARLDRSTGGLIAGADALVGEQWRLGILAGYSSTSFHVDDRASSGSSDNYHLGLYAGTQLGPFGFRSSLAYTWHRIETDRGVAFPGFSDSLSADYDAGTFQAFGELGYRLDTTAASFEPYANLAYVKFDADGFAEGGGAAALSSGDQSSDTTFTTLGLRASTELTFGAVNTTVRGAIGWRHAFGDVRPETGLAFAGGSSFAIEGVPIAENAALFEAGLDVKVTENAKLGIAYQGQIASDAQEHGFNAKLGVRF